jgi:predicted TIM-barrel fold metal-dependent hydrolase
MGSTKPEPLGLVTCVGTHPEDLKWTGKKYGVNIDPACHDGAARLGAMDRDGVDAEMLYPPQRAMLTFMKNPDTEAHLAGIRAYNRWLKDGFCAADPERLIGIFQTPNVGIDTAVAELRRAKAEGFRGVAISAWPSGGDNLSPDDDPFWAAAAELDMPVSIHLLLALKQTKTAASPAAAVAIGATAFSLTMPLITELIFQGVFDRFPGLRMAAVETVGGGYPAAICFPLVMHTQAKRAHPGAGQNREHERGDTERYQPSPIQPKAETAESHRRKNQTASPTQPIAERIDPVSH